MLKPLFFATWILLIFGTSCTVVRPLEFFQLVQSWTGASRASIEGFEIFWGICWFAIVKGWHITEFAILTVLCVGVLKWWRGFIDAKAIHCSMLVCLAFAASDEWHQSFVLDRNGTVQDVLIDGLGIFAAGAVMLIRKKSKADNESEVVR